MRTVRVLMAGVLAIFGITFCTQIVRAQAFDYDQSDANFMVVVNQQTYDLAVCLAFDDFLAAILLPNGGYCGPTKAIPVGGSVQFGPLIEQYRGPARIVWHRWDGAKYVTEQSPTWAEGKP